MPAHSLKLGTRPEDFIWASGIEDTFVPQTRPGHRALDEYQLIGHYQHWREDLALGRELGLKAVRWGIPWYRVEPFPGEFDWRWTDKVIPYLAEELGITPIIDLMHYGCPFWLYREFANLEYPQLVARYAEAFARRYKDLVSWYTPLNEPHVNAVWCGQLGKWPPYLHGEKGYIQIMLQVAKGVLLTVEALKNVDSNFTIAHVEATGITLAGHPDFENRAANEHARNFLYYDLITGAVKPGHPLYKWLLENGADAKTLATIGSRPISLDVVGLNFYPQWSSREIIYNRGGKPAYKIVDKVGQGFTGLVESFYERYQAPILITETSAKDSDQERSAWLTNSLAAIKAMRGRGIPVLGYTWFPMFTMIEWPYRTGRAPLDDYRLELGFYRLGKDAQDKRWHPTPLIDQWRKVTQNPSTSIGTFNAKT
jgi:beta-glucosidase